jgi:hypothetical protein
VKNNDIIILGGTLIQKISVGEPDEYNYMVVASGTSLSITPFSADFVEIYKHERRTITMKCKINVNTGFIIAIMALIIVIKLCA